MISLHELLLHAARAAPTRKAAICGDDVLTYEELECRARRLAAYLRGIGVSPGDRVAYWSPNRLEFLEFLFGVSMSGAIAVPLDHWWSAADVVVAVENCQPSVLLVGPTQSQELVDEGDRLSDAGVRQVIAFGGGTPGSIPYSETQNADPMAEIAPVELDSVALILFTSGSTGRPKGAAHTHRGLGSTAAIMAVELGLKEGETTLHFLPLFSSCLEQLIPLTLLGSTHVIMPHFDAPEAWRLIGEHGVTHFDAVPTVLRRLFDERPTVPPASLRVVSYASEPMPARLIAELTEYAPDISFVQFYGMIEHLCLTALKPNEQLRPSGTVGRPMLGTSLRILDEHQLEVLTGEVGEIVAKGPTIMAGYWEDEIATDQVISSGWMRTGDLARVDEDGYVVLSGRIKEVIKTGGMTVIPREVEEVLRGHPSVEDAAVVGAPSEEWGEEVRAFVVLDESLVLNTAAGELLGHCRQHLPGYKCPKRIEVISELPKTGIGKVARSRLLHDG